MARGASATLYAAEVLPSVALEDLEPLLREHATWALGRIGRTSGVGET